MSDETMFERAWRNEGPKPWKDPFEAIRDVVGVPPKLLNPTPAEDNLSTMLGVTGRIEVRPRHMGRTAEMDRNYRGPQIIGNWRRRQARQELWKQEVVCERCTGTGIVHYGLGLDWCDECGGAGRWMRGPSQTFAVVYSTLPPRRRRAGTFGGRRDSR